MLNIIQPPASYALRLGKIKIMKRVLYILLFLPAFAFSQDSEKTKILLLNTGYDSYGTDLPVIVPGMDHVNTVFNQHFGLYFMNPSIRWISEKGFSELGIRNVHLHTVRGGQGQSLFGGRQLGIVNFDIYGSKGVYLFEKSGTVAYFSLTPTAGYTYSQQFSDQTNDLHFDSHELVGKLFAGLNFTRFFGDRFYTDASIQIKAVSGNYINYDYYFAHQSVLFNRVTRVKFENGTLAPYVNATIGVKL